jgi:hypothetical protein
MLRSATTGCASFEKRLGHRPRQGLVRPEAEEDGGVETGQVRLLRALLVERKEVEGGGVLLVDEARDQPERAVAGVTKVLDEARLARQPLADALVRAARGERTAGEDQGHDLLGGSDGRHGPEAHEAGERVRVAGRQAGLEQLVLEPVEDEVVDVRSGGVSSRPELRGEVAGRRRRAPVETRAEEGDLPRREDHREDGQRGFERARGQPAARRHGHGHPRDEEDRGPRR